MTNATVDGERTEQDGDHLEDVEDGCGCAEIWEHLSERRAQARDDGEP